MGTHKTAKKIATGAGIVAATAGVIAAGAVLADKDTRESLKEGVGGLVDTAKEQTKALGGDNRTYSHNISRKKGGKSDKSSKKS